MGQWDLVRNGLGVDDIIRDPNSVDGAISIFKKYLDDDNLPHPREMRKRQVKDLMVLIRERGQILNSDPRYRLMNEFYQANFGEDFPAWVEDKISRRKYA